MSSSLSSKLLARNVAAVRRFGDPASLTEVVAGNPVSSRLESGVGNCFPGLECDLRNLERRFFPFLEFDPIGNFIVLAGVDEEVIRQSSAAGVLTSSEISDLEILAGDLRAGRSVVVSRLEGTFGVLGKQAFNLAVPEFPGPPPEPAEPGDLNDISTGLDRRPSDAWTAVRLLTEDTEVTLTLKREGVSERLLLKGKRARYLDDNGALAAAFLPGELTQSLCSPWTHDFRDCGCYYWASNHPDIAQPVTPSEQTSGPEWNVNVNWERSNRVVSNTPPAPATSDNRAESDSELRHYEINNRWEELHFVVGRREIVAPFGPKQVQGVPFGGMEELLAQLRFAAGVELAVAHEYLAAAYSLKANDDPAVVAQGGDLRDDIRASRAELMRIAIGEMRHTRVVNDVIRTMTAPAPFVPALRVATRVPGGVLGGLRLVEPRAATRAAIDDFIRLEAPSTAVDGLYTRILATLETPPSNDIANAATDELRQAIRSVMSEGEDHYQTFLNIREWLGNHAESDYLRSTALPRPPSTLNENKSLQSVYSIMLDTMYAGYQKGRFLGATEINSARASMIGLQGIEGAAAAVAARGFLVVFDPPQGDARFEPLPPPPVV